MTDNTVYFTDRMIIAISGKLGAGKDTFAGFLLQEALSNGIDARLEAFATTLKQTAFILTNDHRFADDAERCPVDRAYKDDASIYPGMSNGQLLVALGDCLRKTLGDDVFIRSLASRLHDGLTIITDMRTNAEAEWVHERKGMTIRIDGDPTGIRARTTRDNKHRTETELDDYAFDHVIANDRDLNALREAARRILQQ